MPGRKIGVGFKHPRVLDGRMQFDWRSRWSFMRRMARLSRGRQLRRHRPLPASAVDASRMLMRDTISRRQ